MHAERRHTTQAKNYFTLYFRSLPTSLSFHGHHHRHYFYLCPPIEVVQNASKPFALLRLNIRLADAQVTLISFWAQLDEVLVDSTAFPESIFSSRLDGHFFCR